MDTALGQKLYALAFLEHGTRRLHIAGVIAHPTREWTAQRARNLAVNLGRHVESLRFLLRGRDDKYSPAFDTVLKTDDIEVIESAPPAPRMNAHCERIIKTLRDAILDQTLISNDTHAPTPRVHGLRPGWFGDHPGR
ncbi:hypothetical protein AB0H34_43130 [Saccharopolyspora shandongensis]|uniref:hypothetical protein n=1 Tax=Saccharopolyspora shandongensis TaxID=418495 RepID=UPI0033FEEC0A